MSNDDTREFTLGTVFRDEDLTTLYWLNDGKVQYRHYPIREIKDADVASFEAVQSPIPSRDFIQAAKDCKHHYSNDGIVSLREFEEELYGKDGKPR